MKINTYTKKYLYGIGIAYGMQSATDFMSLYWLNKSKPYIHMHTIEFVFFKWALTITWDTHSERP